MQRAIIYPRVSTSKQEDGVSLADQERHARTYCAQQGYEVVKVIPETYSGYDSLDVRPGLQQAREMVRRGEADVIVCWRFDRLARETTDTLMLVREISQAGGRLESATEGTIENTPLGKMMAAARGFASETERDAIIARTQGAIRTRAESGKILTGKSPKLGYRYVGDHKDTYAVDEETAPIVRHIFDLAYHGASLHGIANTLTAEGTPTATQILATRGYPVKKVATKWGRQMVYQLLTDPSYCGRHVVYRRQLVKRRVVDETGRTFERKVLKLRAEDDTRRIEQTIPAIVSEEMWEAVQANLRERSLQTPRTSRVADDTLLRNFVYCGHCGGKMVSHAHHHGYRQYRCSHRRNNAASLATPPCTAGGAVKAAVIDKDVWQKVAEMGADLPHVERMLAQRQAKMLDSLAAGVRDATNIDAEIASQQQQLELLQKRLGVETDDFMYANLREQMLKAHNMLKGLEARKARIADRETHAGMLLAAFEDANRVLHRQGLTVIMSREEMRKVLKALGVRVFVYATNSEYAKTHDTRWEFTVADGGTTEILSTAI